MLLIDELLLKITIEKSTKTAQLWAPPPDPLHYYEQYYFFFLIYLFYFFQIYLSSLG